MATASSMMAITKEELDSFNRYVAAKMNNGANLSLEDCLRLWRQQRSAESPPDEESAFDVLTRAGLIGCIETRIGDLSTGRQHWEGFGEH